MDRRRQVVLVARGLETWGAEHGWRGTDPYDALNATRRFLRPLKSTPLGRRLLIQAVKRSPLDLRPLFGISPSVSSASVALVVSAYARGGFLEAEESRGKLIAALELLEQLRSECFTEPCWGYHFDFQSRVVHYRRGEPNTIATAFAGSALLDAYDRLGDPSLLDEALQVAEFFLRRVGQTRTVDGAYFGYHPGDRSPIHNSNMLACAVLARASAAAADKRMAETAAAGLRYHPRPSTPGWVVAVRRERRPRLGGQLPYRLRPRLAAHLHRCRDRRDRRRAGVAPGRCLLPAHAFFSPMARPSISRRGSIRSTLSPSPKGFRPSRSPHCTTRHMPRPHAGSSTSPAVACSKATGCRSSSAVTFGRTGRFTSAGRSPRLLLPVTHLIGLEDRAASAAIPHGDFPAGACSAGPPSSTRGSHREVGCRSGPPPSPRRGWPPQNRRGFGRERWIDELWVCFSELGEANRPTARRGQPRPQ